MELSDSEIEAAYTFVTEQLGRTARKETFWKRFPPAYERLVEAAENGEYITYSELADYANTDNREYMSILLDGIGFVEEQRGNPPLTVLVVHADDGRPASEFLDLLDSLGIRDQYDSTTEDGLVDEITEVVFECYGASGE